MPNLRRNITISNGEGFFSTPFITLRPLTWADIWHASSIHINKLVGMVWQRVIQAFTVISKIRYWACNVNLVFLISISKYFGQYGFCFVCSCSWIFSLNFLVLILFFLLSNSRPRPRPKFQELTLFYPCNNKKNKNKNPPTKTYQQDVNYRSEICYIDLTHKKKIR